MRVLMVSWEYSARRRRRAGTPRARPPRELAAAGHEVVVLSRRPSGTDAETHPTLDEVRDGIRVLAVAEDPAHLEFERDMVAWTLALGHALLRAALTRLGGWRP